MSRVAIFGEPTSGKSSVAESLAQELDCKLVEASKEIVFPIACHFSNLPNEKELLESLPKLDLSRDIDRKKARHTFQQLKEKYSPEFIAKALHMLYVRHPNFPYVIFSGLRGLDNAKYCRLHNDFVVFLKADKEILVTRMVEERKYSKEQAKKELVQEELLYNTSKIESIANLVVNTSGKSVEETRNLVLKAFQDSERMCKKCVNTAKNPMIKFNENGYCHICATYIKGLDKEFLKEELELFKSFKGKSEVKYDVVVGISGGKDSTATLHTINEMGFTPLAVTFDLGYLPETTIPRAKQMAKQLSTDHEVIDIRHYIRDIDVDSYEKTVQLYELPFTLETKKKFQEEYAKGRKHYSVKCLHSPVFVRTCQLCRRTVIRAYYEETLKIGAKAIVVGINEWTNLSAAQEGEYKVSGIRKLQPFKDKPPIYVVHLPFILQRTSDQTKIILDKIGWVPPEGEDFIESNSNSCLYARSTERMAKRLLEFHPDSTRLAREVTVGFISKKQALKALGKIHPYDLSPRQVLERAGIL
jgi:broad-specificity NMP kinase